MQLFVLLQKGIMEVLFDIFQLKEPEWTDDFHVALLSVGKINKHKLHDCMFWSGVTEASHTMSDTSMRWQLMD